jgi:hypothetical protein
LKKTILFLMLLLFAFPAFAVEDLTPADNSTPATPTTQTCLISPSQYGQLIAANSQLATAIAELRANSISSADLNKIIPPMLEYYEKETISREMIVLVIFFVLIMAILALAKIKRFF